MWIVYILELSDGSYYTGITNNLHKRLGTHKSGKGSKYVRSRLPFRVVYICNERNRSEASKCEAAIKKLSRKEKELLVKGDWFKDDEETINFLCESCDVVIMMKRVDFPYSPDKTHKMKFEIECSICKNILIYEE